MTTTAKLALEFHTLAIEDLREAGREDTLSNIYHTLYEWCEIYEDVPPRNRAERAVRDGLIVARELIAQQILTPSPS